MKPVDDESEKRLTLVVDRFNAMLARDGARLEVESAGEGEVGLRYVAGPGGVCETCVLQPEDLSELIGEALGGRTVTVRVAEG